MNSEFPTRRFGSCLEKFAAQGLAYIWKEVRASFAEGERHQMAYKSLHCCLLGYKFSESSDTCLN
jgi:hypothetical protein